MKVKVWRERKTHLFWKTQRLVLRQVYHYMTTPPHKAMTRIPLLLQISNRRDVRVGVVMVWGVVWMEVVIVEVEMVKEEREVVRVVMVRGVVVMVRVAMVKEMVRMTPTLQTRRWTPIWFCYPLSLAIWRMLKEMGKSKLISLKPFEVSMCTPVCS